MQGWRERMSAEPVGDRIVRFCVGLAFTVHFFTVKNYFTKPLMGTDSLIYHLPIPALWTQHGFLSTVELPLHDGLCEHSPMLFHTVAYFLMRLTGGDVLVGAIQPLCFLAILWVFHKSTRLLGASRQIAWAFTSCLVFFIPFAVNARVCNNDLMLTLGAALLLHGVLRVAEAEAPASAVYTATAGVAVMVATKHVGVVYAVVGIGVLAGAAVHRHRTSAEGRRLFPARVALLAVLIASAGLVFHIRNLILFGNPFYPNTFRFAGIEICPGLFDLSVFRDHGWSLSALCRALLEEPNVFALQMPVSGILWLGVFLPPILLLTPHRGLVRLPHLTVASLFPIASVALYFGLVPFWQHHRLLFPVYYGAWLGAAYAAALLSRLRPEDGSEGRALTGTLLIFAVQALSLHIWAAPGFGYALVAGVAGAAYRRPGHRVRRVMRRAGLVAVALAAIMFPGWCWRFLRIRAGVRKTYYERYYGPIGRAWSLVDDMGAGQGGVTVAYAGTAQIYPLFGPRLRNRVVYLRLSRADRPGPVSFRRGEEQYRSVIGARRSQFDEEFWLRQLDQQQVQLLFLVTNDQRGGVEHELATIGRHPERFQELCREEDVVLYEVLPRPATD